MKIIRNSIEFELTKEELVSAYYEQQFEFDKTDTLDKIIEMDLDNETRENLLLNIDDIAEDMRYNIDKYNMDWSYARDEAINEHINKEE